MTIPQLRQGVINRTVGDQILAYDTAHDQVHSLGSEMSRVFVAVDGNRTPDDIAHLTGLPSDTVQFALEALADKALIAAPTGGMSRRTLVAAAAAGAAALTISTVASPTSAQASSCLNPAPGGNFCESLSAFMAEAVARGDLEGIAPGTCGTTVFSFGTLATCAGFQLFFTDPNAPFLGGSTLPVGLTYQWCRDSSGLPYVRMSDGSTIGPIATSAVSGCPCSSSSCLVEVDLDPTGRFVTAYQVPPGSMSLGYELCHTADEGVPVRSVFRIWTATLDAAGNPVLGSQILLDSAGTTFIRLGTVEGYQMCAAGCANIPPLAPGELLVVTWNALGPNPGRVYINLIPSPTPCSVIINQD